MDTTVGGDHRTALLTLTRPERLSSVSEDLIDELERRLPQWKKTTASGSCRWVSPNASVSVPQRSSVKPGGGVHRDLGSFRRRVVLQSGVPTGRSVWKRSATIWA